MLEIEVHSNPSRKNPLVNHIIVDNIIKSLSFKDLKNVRFVSNLWNEVAAKELSKRGQKPILFETPEEFGQNEKLDQIINLKRSRQEIFENQLHLNFTNFLININLLTFEDQLDTLFEEFCPKYIQIFGKWSSITSEPDVQDLLFKFLKRISAHVEEIGYNFRIVRDNLDSRPDLCQELSSIGFPKLRKISHSDFASDKITEICLYSIIGQNSPNFCHLKLSRTSNKSFGDDGDEIKEKFERTGFMSKLKILEFLDMDSVELLEIFTQFPALKLSKFSFTNGNCFDIQDAQNFAKFLSSQSESLEILNFENLKQPEIEIPLKIQFCRPLIRLTELQIGYFGEFSIYFEPLNFSHLFPNLKKFTTFDIITFMRKNIGVNGDSVNYVNLFKKSESRRWGGDFEDSLDFKKIDQIFPNLKVLELAFSLIPNRGELGENLPFWRKIEKVRMHLSQGEGELFINKELINAPKRLEIEFFCEKIFTGENDPRNRLKEKYLIEDLRASGISPASFTLSGFAHKVSENFRTEIRNILPKCVFIEII